MVKVYILIYDLVEKHTKKAIQKYDYICYVPIGF